MNREEVIEKLAQKLHSLQVESAKLNDEHTEGISAYYLDFYELSNEMKQWYKNKALSILNAIHELAIVDRKAQPPDNPYNRPDYAVAFDNAIIQMYRAYWVKEIRE